jgi:hypothetical protein
MQAYETEWLTNEPVLSAIMNLVGLFDRPATPDCLQALRRSPTIPGLTEPIVGLGPDAWAEAVFSLREVRLLAPEDSCSPDGLDAHPLVRGWFGERLRNAHPDAWALAHGRVYEHLRDNTKEGRTPTLQDLEPLYQAIAHGCRAGRYHEALHDIYIGRICRQSADGKIEFYARIKLGAVGSDLAALSWFFDRPYEVPASGLTAEEKAWVLSTTGFRLRSNGRISEALPAERAGLEMAEADKDWVNAAIRATNLSEVELLIGNVQAALNIATKSVKYAKDTKENNLIVIGETTRADALHAIGQFREANRLFSTVEKQHRKRNPDHPFLFCLQGYQFCDLLLSRGAWSEVIDRSSQTVNWVKTQGLLFETALDHLILGRANFGRALERLVSGQSLVGLDWACVASKALDLAVDGLVAAGTMDHVPRGLLSRAAFRRCVGNAEGAARDLDDLEEIASAGPMRLFLCDMALERARLALARIEGFAPINGFIDDSPAKPPLPDAAEAQHLQREAANHLVQAREVIKSCRYLRRNRELTELEAVSDGQRTFAKLPPRV